MPTLVAALAVLALASGCSSGALTDAGRGDGAGGDDGGFGTCTASGPSECVDVPFDLPGAAVVEGTLP